MLSPMTPVNTTKLNRSVSLLEVCGLILSLLFFGFSSHLEAAIFARDSETELAIELPDAAGAGGTFSLTHFTSSSAEEDFDFGGSLKLDGKIYRLEEQPDEKSNASVVIAGDLEGEQLDVKTSGLTDGRKNSYDFSGTYRKLSDAELQQRAQRHYDEADKWLNKIYDQAKNKLATGSFADLRRRETDWIKYRDWFAEQSAGLNWKIKSTPEAVVRLQALRDLTISRIEFIRRLLDDSLPAGITAVYGDEYGGVLELEKDGEAFKFSLSVVRGPTLHTGDVSGRFILKNRSGTFRDPDPSDGEPPAEITFNVLDDRRVEIKARNDGYLHGARAYFDGVYFKSGPLTKSIKLE
jgi:uncharacterized protein YecT (DUF1311 family)